ncbi:MAG: FkbM family methyltransferase, partial [Pseudanabaena sp.]
MQVTDSEVNIIQQFISSGDVVFDVGANVGNWSYQVLSNHTDVEIHMFEAIPQSYYTLIKNYSRFLTESNIFPNNIALSNCNKIQDYYFYSQDPALSTTYRRLGVEQLLNLATPTKLSLPTITLDTYCQQRNIHHINFLKIDVEGAELDILMGAIQFLKKGSIDIIQFE